MNVPVIDDGEGLRRLMRRIIERAGHEVTAASDGGGALAALGARRFDVVVTDMRMPGLSGADVIRAVRSSHGAMRLVAMSGDFQDCDSSAERARALGADAVLSKPFTQRDLLSCLEACPDLTSA